VKESKERLGYKNNARQERERAPGMREDMERMEERGKRDLGCEMKNGARRVRVVHVRPRDNTLEKGKQRALARRPSWRLTLPMSLSFSRSPPRLLMADSPRIEYKN